MGDSYQAFIQSIPVSIPNLHKHPLDYVLQQEVIPSGYIIELGVFQGGSIIKIANKFPDRPVYGFDSFEGLPESWERPDGHYVKGAFNTNKKLPQVPNNVTLIPGWFDQTLPGFAASMTDNIALLHIDCDLYSSTKCTFQNLGKYIVPGTVIVFDELFNYPTYEKHELLAFYEFLKESNHTFEWIGKNGNMILHPVSDNGYWDQPAALRITS